MTNLDELPIDRDIHPVGLCTEDDSGLVAISLSRPRLRWRLAGNRPGSLQLAYEVQRCALGDFSGPVTSTGQVVSHHPVAAQWPGPPLASREVTWLRVRVWTQQGVTRWSDPLRVEASLLEADDWIARPITPPANRNRIDPAPPVLFRRAFTVEPSPVTARLYVTALGVYQFWINGLPLSPDLFEPGWSAYHSRLLFAAHDVTKLLRPGRNALAAMVGDGWWRGTLTWIPRRAVYGATTALLAQLELHYADGQRQIVPTDETWRAGEGQVRMADLYNGCRIDHAREPTGWTGPDFDDGEWSAVECLPLPRGLRQRAMPPVRVVDTFSVNPIGAPDLLHADCGQNLTGWLRLTVEAQCGGVVDVRHAEVLEPDGGLHLSSLRTAEARDRYMVRAGRHELEPAFTYHGFRHAEIACAPGIEIVACEARVVSSDLRRIGHFRCSDERVNRLYENIIWSQRGNFLAIPTDCPQRDERLGWTGDIQVFAPTACTNFDCRTFLGQWLADLAAEQRADGNVPSTVPNVLQGHLHEYGGVGWGDAATLVPWAMYEAYGDAAILARQYASMKAWVDYGLSRLDANGLWIGDFQLGDWLDPAAPPGYPEQATTDRDFIATAYLAHSARTLGKAAGILGHAAQADFYRDRAERLAQACWQRWQKAVLATQTGCAMAICFDIAPPSELLRIGARLARLVEVNHGRIGTGFLGTPLVLPALTRTGQHAAALRLLLNPLAPGWLYQVEMGATTIWERWDAIRPDGSIHPGDMAAKDSPGMMSFNHYAYGSVGCWLYRTLAGIAPAEPGYAVIDFAPQPGEGIDWAEARIETPFGMAAVSWRRSGKALSVCCQVPPGARGRFIPPSGWRLAGDALPSFGSGDVTFSLLAEAG